MIHRTSVALLTNFHFRWHEIHIFGSHQFTSIARSSCSNEEAARFNTDQCSLTSITPLLLKFEEWIWAILLRIQEFMAGAMGQLLILTTKMSPFIT